MKEFFDFVDVNINNILDEINANSNISGMTLNDIQKEVFPRIVKLVDTNGFDLNSLDKNQKKQFGHKITDKICEYIGVEIKAPTTEKTSVIFKKYCDIENSYNKKHLTNHNFMNVPAVATLKIDGSNISFNYSKKDEYRVGKRTSLLGNDENFYKMNEFRVKYADNVKDIAHYLFTKYYDCISISIFGEVFGGSYKHPDVAFDINAKAIQKRIAYSAHNHIAIFDIAIMIEDENGEIHRKWLDWQEVVDLCNTYNMPLVPEVSRGTIGELMEFDVESLEDPMYKIFNLPKIEGNMAEGIVIKPLEELRFGNGERVIVKYKSQKFVERSNVKTDTISRDEKVRSMPEEYQNILNDILSYIVPSRYFSIISKMGEVSEKDFKEISSNFREDVLNDYARDFNIDDFNEIQGEEKKLITKIINTEISKIIKDYLIFGKEYSE